MRSRFLFSPDTIAVFESTVPHDVSLCSSHASSRVKTDLIDTGKSMRMRSGTDVREKSISDLNGFSRRSIMETQKIKITVSKTEFSELKRPDDKRFQIAITQSESKTVFNIFFLIILIVHTYFFQRVFQLSVYD